MMQMTEQIARAAGWDAGDASMERGGRTAWNEDDYNAAAREYARLWPVERQLAEGN
jgi:hypothetical protein